MNDYTNTTKKRHSPLYPSETSIEIHDIQRHRRLFNYLIQLWRRKRRNLNFPPETNLILSYVPQLCFVPCFLLSYACCRVGELNQIKTNNIRLRKSFKIKSTKSKHIKLVPALPDFKPDLRLSVDPKTMLVVVSYDHLKNSIRQAKKRADLPSIDNILDLTHIFRHYQASFMARSGHELDEISEKLGHLNNETTLKYIH